MRTAYSYVKNDILVSQENLNSADYLLSDRAGHFLCLGVTILSPNQ